MFEFFKNAFKDMKKSAAAQHEVDKAKFEAVKTESRANFEENRWYNTLERAKADARESLNEAGSVISSRKDEMERLHEEELALANERIEAANKRIEAVKRRD